MPKDPPEKSPKGVFQSDEARAIAELRRRQQHITSGEIMVPSRTPVSIEEERTPPPHSVKLTVEKLWDETREDVKETPVDRARPRQPTDRALRRGRQERKGRESGEGATGGIVSRSWWFVGILLGGLGGMIGMTLKIVRAFDALEAKADRTEITAERNARTIIELATQNAQLSAQVQTLQNLVLSRRRGSGVDREDYPDKMTP
jgi:hypothetical protein